MIYFINKGKTFFKLKKTIPSTLLRFEGCRCGGPSLNGGSLKILTIVHFQMDRMRNFK